MDIKTIFICVFVVSAIGILIYTYIYLFHTRNFAGSGYYLAAMSCMSFSTLIFGLQNLLSPMFILFAANAAFLVTPTLIGLALRKFYGMPVSKFFIGMAIVFVLTFFYFIPTATVKFRIILFSVLLFFLFWDPLIALLRVKKKRADLLLRLSFIFFAIISLYRAVITFLGPEVKSLMEGGVIQGIYLLSVLILWIMLLVGYFILILTEIYNKRFQAEAKLNTAVDQSPYGIVFTDTKGNINYANNAFAGMTGYSRDYIVGKNIRILNSGKQESNYYEKMWKTILAGKSWQGELVNVKKDGTLYWDKSLIHGITDQEGNISQFFSIKEDISDRKELELFRERANLEMENDLELAKIIQQNLIPAKEPVEYITSLYKPMMAVGGDFFDFIQFKNSAKIGIFISDVSGHGISAALVTSMVKSLIMQARRHLLSPASLLRYLNSNLYNAKSNYFITAFYGIYDPLEREFVYSNAAHPSPLHISESGIASISRGKSTIIGMFDDEQIKEMGKEFENFKVQISPGEKLLFYTDGLTEAAPSAKAGNYEASRFLNFLTENRNLPPDTFLSGLMTDLKNYCKTDTFEDDICAICLDVK